ncbi:DNA mismatch repair endonuclease MutL [Horticoccus luteus]|uniref:DNA mismatch repair protein MutL n=1 Tax=Horticoccus luteus TaxID=2862869 RepID=A0A8F9TUS7_9BACT|nr:DNA mismatch repair endonuclease MutL [Horticoccus luteus]QYM78381.1 DNA mismatch repair endonuclease MutL [Horticoccus luteus]
MAKVRILSDRVANQIAAGEVIERPAAVVKELVENALDAGATRIEVEFRHGGRALMRVEDNGQGMMRDDALLALERHATSKIAEADDLDRLASYGFRGEALPSIASVSRFELQTREASADVGTEILVNGGKFVHVRDCGRPVGTRIEVAQLFNSVPARRKFLKTDQTEAAHIIQCVRLYALACPGTAFTLIEDGHVVFRSPQAATLRERVGEIFGRQTAGEIVSIEAAEAGMRLSGLIGRPGFGRGTRHEMIVFVNGRPVDSRTLNYALIESYHESLPKGRYPVAFLFFECDPAAVDVNVHPAKREVRFRSEPAVRGFVIRAVLARLRELSAGVAAGGAEEIRDRREGQETPPFEMRNPVEAGGKAQATGMARPLQQDGRVAAGRAVQLGNAGASYPGNTLPAGSARDSASAARPGNAGHRESGTAEATPVAMAKPGAPAWRFVGLAHGSYVLFETAAGLVLLDRRAAHERVWFERLQDQFQGGAVPSQRLLLPVPIELDPIAAAMLLDRLAFLAAHGLDVAEFGRNFFRVEGVPGWMEPADAEGFLRDVLGAMREGRMQTANVDLAREELARLAVAKAVRLPAEANETAVQALVAQLFATRSPLTSPAGRPTFIELNHSELARRFQK